MNEFMRAMEIMAKYHDFPAFSYDQVEKVVYGQVNREEIPEDSVDGRRLTEMGWQLNDDVWEFYL